MKRWAKYLTPALLICALPADAAVVSTRRATMTGSRGDQGKCTVEVRVDGTAEVELYGDSGRLRTLAGQPAQWVRMECSDRIPSNPADFRFRGIDGRGRVQLVADPRSNRGVAVVRIDDPQGGTEGYTFDLEWRGVGGGSYGAPPPQPPPYAGGGAGGRMNAAEAVRTCELGVRDRARRDGYRDINILRIAVDNNPGRNDWVVGTFEARSRGGRDRLEFACSVDFRSGRVRSVDIRRR
jgi:hypothetical protein